MAGGLPEVFLFPIFLQNIEMQSTNRSPYVHNIFVKSRLCICNTQFHKYVANLASEKLYSTILCYKHNQTGI